MSIQGLFDANKEQQRLQKQQAKLEKDLQGLQGRLKNPKFVQNAKPEVVKEAQQAAAEGEQKLALSLMLPAGLKRPNGVKN